MDARQTAFINGLDSITTEELRSLCANLFCQKQDLQDKLRETENAAHEMALQFQQMRLDRDAAMKENRELKKQNLHLTEVLALRTQEMFGKSSEKVSGLIQEDAFEDPLDENGASELAHTRPGRKISSRRGHRSPKRRRAQRRKREDILAGLPVQEIFDFDIDKLNEQFGEGKWRFANWHCHDRVEYIKASTYIKRTYTPVVSVGLEHMLYTIPWEGSLLPKSLASPSLVARIMFETYGLSLPFYRQEHDPEHFGFNLSRQTANNWVNTCAHDYLKPVYDHLCSLLKEQHYQQCDETTWHVLHPGEDGGAVQYMWVHCTSELSEEKMIIAYCYENSRSADHLRRFYKGLDHTVHLTCDAFSSYPAFADETGGLVIICGCMMHSRRRFADAFRILTGSGIPDTEMEETPEWKVLRLIGDIYYEDEALKELSPEERLLKRKEIVKEKAEDFFDFIHGYDTTLPGISEKMKDAVEYTQNHEKELCQFLSDGNVPIDNGHCERAVKAVALTRKNSLFSNTVRGAESAAMIWSLIETAKAHNADAYYYLKYLLEQMPGRVLPTAENGPDHLDQMTPWSEEYLSYEKEQKMNMIRQSAPPGNEKPETPKKQKRKKISLI